MITAVVLKIRKSKFRINDGIFWFLLSILFLAMSIFPQAAMWLSGVIGVESPANLVFLGILSLLLIKNFLLSIKISQLESNLMKLTQRVVVEEKGDREKGEGRREKKDGREEETSDKGEDRQEKADDVSEKGAV